jgi:hypothetical protein
MDQNPLPRGSLQVRDRLGEEVRTVPELPESAAAVEAQYPAHPTGAMIVVEVLWIGRPTDRAATTLSGEQLVELHLPGAGAPGHTEPVPTVLRRGRPCAHCVVAQPAPSASTV